MGRKLPVLIVKGQASRCRPEILSMIGIVRFPMIFAPLSHVCRYVARVVLVPFARSGVCLCFVAPFGWLSWAFGVEVLCISRSATRLAIGCQSIRAVLILAKFSKVGFSAGWAFLRTHDNVFITYVSQTQEGQMR